MNLSAIRMQKAAAHQQRHELLNRDFFRFDRAKQAFIGGVFGNIRNRCNREANVCCVYIRVKRCIRDRRVRVLDFLKPCAKRLARFKQRLRNFNPLFFCHLFELFFFVAHAIHPFETSFALLE